MIVQHLPQMIRWSTIAYCYAIVQHSGKVIQGGSVCTSVSWAHDWCYSAHMTLVTCRPPFQTSHKSHITKRVTLNLPSRQRERLSTLVVNDEVRCLCKSLAALPIGFWHGSCLTMGRSSSVWKPARPCKIKGPVDYEALHYPWPAALAESVTLPRRYYYRRISR